MRCVIFDLDGTLADTSADLLAAANACFRSLGLPDLLDARDAGTAMRGGRAMLTLGFARAGGHGPEEVERQYPRLLRFYEDAICEGSFLYPGAVDAVERLRRDGTRVGVCTNKPERLADLLLARLGARGLFHSLVGADTLPVRKPHPDPLRLAVARAGGDMARACLVGDTATDREAARAAAIPCALVTFGPDGDAVAALAPEALVRGFAELPAVVGRLLGAA